MANSKGLMCAPVQRIVYPSGGHVYLPARGGFIPFPCGGETIPSKEQVQHAQEGLRPSTGKAFPPEDKWFLQRAWLPSTGAEGSSQAAACDSADSRDRHHLSEICNAVHIV